LEARSLIVPSLVAAVAMFDAGIGLGVAGRTVFALSGELIRACVNQCNG
jgi:hypothetical protein